MWWIYVGCLLEDVGEKDPCGGMKYQTDLESFLIITSPFSRVLLNTQIGHYESSLENITRFRVSYGSQIPIFLPKMVVVDSSRSLINNMVVLILLERNR